MTNHRENFEQRVDARPSSGANAERLSDYVRELDSFRDIERWMRPRSDSPRSILPDFDILGRNSNPERGFGPVGALQWSSVESQLRNGRESVHDQITRHALERMSPQERQRYDQERQAIANYHAQVSRLNPWSEMIVPYPSTPMHDQLGRTVERIHNAINERVQMHMSPLETQRLRSELAKSDSSGLLSTAPAVGQALKGYYELVRQETRNYLRNH